MVESGHASRPHVSQWSRYWQTGARTSLPLNFDQNYDGEVEAFWSQCFSALDGQARIADVCCGNGAVAMLAAKHREEKNCAWSIDAFDAANLDTAVLAACWRAQAAALSRVSFHGNQPLESWAPSEGRFDLIGSQYGLEYCDVEAAAPRLIDGLAPAGRLVVVSHVNDGEVHSTMQLEMAGYRALEASGVLSVLKSWHINQLSTTDFLRRVRRTGQRLADQRPRSPLIDSVLQALSALLAMEPAQLVGTRQQAGDYHLDLVTARQRAEDLLTVMERVSTDQWLEPLLKHGLKIVLEQALHDSHGSVVGIARIWELH